MTRPVIILGAGPAGIGAALALGAQATVLERGQRPAGLSGTVVLDGAVFDLGGHSFHTPHGHVRDLVFGAVKMEEQCREAWCWTQGNWIAYPFQKHVGDIADPTLRSACIAGMAAADGGRDAPHFDAYIDARFGRAVADAFMRPYNRKLWGDDLSRLTTDWAGERVAGPLGQREHFAEQGGNRTPLQAQTRVAYPARGGFGAIFDALADRVDDLRLETQVVAIDPARRTLTTHAGRTLGWDSIVSTLALPVLLDVVSGVPPAIRRAAAALEAMPVDLVMIVLEGRGPVDRQRVYCPDADMPGHKVILNHSSSQWLRDQPRHGIQMEVSCARAHPTGLADTVIDDLVRIGLIAGRSAVRRAVTRHLSHGYPVPTHARDTVIREIRAWLAERAIHICGRFAEWAYINADEALARGLAVGTALDSTRSRGRAVEQA